MKAKLFWKKNCPKCPEAKEALKKSGLKYSDYDIEDVDGLAEAAYYSIMTTPSILIVDEKNNEVTSWRGLIPSPEEIIQQYQ